MMVESLDPLKKVWLTKHKRAATLVHRSRMVRRARMRKASLPESMPPVVLPIDSTGGQTVSCPMDGNDSLGDCGEAMVCHVDNILTFRQGKGQESTFNLDDLEEQYEQVSGGDNGLDEDEVVNQIWGESIAGVTGARLAADANGQPMAMDFDITDSQLTQVLIDNFYAVCMAWSVPDEFLENFQTGSVWPTACTPDPENGHFTPLADVRKGSIKGTIVDGFYGLYTWGGYAVVSPQFVASVQPQSFVGFSPRQFDPATGLDSKNRHIAAQANLWVALGGARIAASELAAFPPPSSQSSNWPMQKVKRHTFQPPLRGAESVSRAGAEGAVNIDVLWAILQLASDLSASGLPIGSAFRSLIQAIQARTGIVVALETLAADLTAAGTSPQILADLVRIATDLGLPLPVTGPLAA